MKQLTPQFAETIPKEIEEGTLYISMNFHTCSHLCPCGCKRRIVTPLSPAGWTLIFDGKVVSLEPSIGNWSLPCQSHYWITRNCIVWAPTWSRERITRGHLSDQQLIEEFYGGNDEKNKNVDVTKVRKKKKHRKEESKAKGHQKKEHEGKKNKVKKGKNKKH